MNAQDLGIGRIITTPQQRDAIHMAVAPCEAAHKLTPGMHVGLNTSGQATNRTEKPVGVVDPFLKQPAEKGEKVWVLLYPGSIKSLRHEWQHPAFDALPPLTFTAQEKARAASVEWMTDWAVRHMQQDLSDYGRAKTREECFDYAIRAGHEMSVGPCEDARDYIDNEWWNHWETITGKTGNRDEFFSCSC